MKATGKTTYKVKYVLGVSVSEKDNVQPEELLALDDKIGFGAPAAYKDRETWRPAIYVAPAPDKKSYVLGWAGEMSQVAGATPLVVTKVYRKGDQVWASTLDVLKPVIITDVVDDGVQYKFKDKGEEKTVTFNAVTSPL